MEDIKDIVVLSDRVLIECNKSNAVTPGGIHLPDKVREKSQTGKVICIGEGKLLDDRTRQKGQVHRGDMVLFIDYAGTEVKVNGKEYLVMRESDIIAILFKD